MGCNPLTATTSKLDTNVEAMLSKSVRNSPQSPKLKGYNPQKESLGTTQRQGYDLRKFRTLQGEGTSCVAHLPAPMEVARARPDVVAAAVLVDHLATAVLLRVRRVRELKPARESSET